MKINVIGLGYIGLPTALMMASSGLDVIGTDYNKDLVQTLKEGKVTFEEEGLGNLFKDAINNGIDFTDKYQQADVYIIAVPTPYDKKSKKLDSRYVISAIKDIMKVCNKGAIIVIESTISPATIDRQVRPVIKERAFKLRKDLHIAHAPERIIPGNMIKELLENSRTIGVDDKEIGEILKKIYTSFCKGEIVITDIRTAEMSKVVENTYRDINIAFANELAKICRQDDMDVYEIIRIANKHPRVNILTPGPGVGGHCISVDPWFLVGDYPENTQLIKQARFVNDSMPEFVLERIKEIMKKNKIKTISRVGLYGLTYKENVDDVRESPTLQLLDIIKRDFSENIQVYDPMVKKPILPGQCLNYNEFLDSIDMVVIMVGHQHIRKNLGTIKEKIVLDTRNVCKGFGDKM